MESRQDEEEDPGRTPEPDGGPYPFLDWDVWERSGEEDPFKEEIAEEDAGNDEYRDADEDQEDEESLVPSGTRMIVIDSDQDEVSLQT